MHGIPPCGGDCLCWAASLDTQKMLCGNHIPVVAHMGMIPSTLAWTNVRAVGKTPGERAIQNHVRRLKAIGCFGAEPGPTLSIFSPRTYWATRGHKLRHSKSYRDVRAEHDRLQQERIAAFREFIADVNSVAHPEPRHVVVIAAAELDSFLAAVAPSTPALAAE